MVGSGRLSLRRLSAEQIPGSSPTSDLTSETQAVRHFRRAVFCLALCIRLAARYGHSGSKLSRHSRH